MNDLWALVDHAAQRWPDDPMLVSRQGDHCTFSEFRDRARRMAGGLAGQGIARGDVVSWILPTWVDTVVLAAALSYLGAIQNPIIGIYRDHEVSFCVDQTKARFLITPDQFAGFDFAAMGQRIVLNRAGLSHIVVSPGSFPAGDPSSLVATVAAGPRQTQWICYTSGTAADPKGARHADATVGAFAAAMAECMDVIHGDRYALVFPFPHIGGIGLLFMTLTTGCTHLLDDTVDPHDTVEFLAQQRCTHAGTGTAFFNMYLALQQTRSDPIFPDLKACPAGGAPTAAALQRRVERELGAPVVSSWGLTEAPVLTSGRLTDPAHKRATTEGRPLPGVDLRVVGDDEVLRPTGVPGELRVRSPQLMLGYQDPALDADAFDAQGYYRTGDVGVIDDEGFVTITGRLKDIIIRNGENISARDIETLLLEIDGISDAAAIALPDARTGEAVCAVIVVRGTAPTLDDIRGALTAAGLRRQALPSHLVVRDALPRSPAGKVLKRLLVNDQTNSTSSAEPR
jgi:acyl-CoA synthetase (AMP-forming)/AMP-acid ligase II